MKRCFGVYRQEIVDEQEESKQELDSDEIDTLADSRLMEVGVRTTDPDEVICEDYTEDEIKEDHDAVDWEIATEEVRKIEDERLRREQEEKDRIKEEEDRRKREEFEAIARQREEEIKR